MLDFINYTISSFEDYISEKQGVIERNIYTEIDVTDMSKIINQFMRHIIMKPNDEYEKQETIFNELIKIKYQPISFNPNVNGVTKKDIIYIYKKVNDNNYLDVKYTLAHEMVHMIHQILSKNNRPYEDLSDIDKLRYDLIKITSDNIKNYKNSKYLMMLLYMIDTNEVYSRNQNAYIESFKYKREHPEISNQEIVSNVLNKIRMSNKYLEMSISELKTDKSAFSLVVSFLVGNFHELGESGYQQYFDKSIYQIPIVKIIRKEIKNSIYNEFYIDKMKQKTLNIIKKYKSELDEYKPEILDSFIKHMEYWFREAQKRIGKAIQLGIDDAIEIIN